MRAQGAPKVRRPKGPGKLSPARLSAGREAPEGRGRACSLLTKAHTTQVKWSHRCQGTRAKGAEGKELWKEGTGSHHRTEADTEVGAGGTESMFPMRTAP